MYRRLRAKIVDYIIWFQDGTLKYGNYLLDKIENNYKEILWKQ